MSNFTPGPWTHRNGRIFQTDYEQLTIANVGRAFDGDYSPANGDLMADAPELLDALSKAIDLVERKTCTHEDTYRGGIIWEICRGCGAMWADDEGGKPDFKWPDSVEQARALIAKHRGGV